MKEFTYKTFTLGETLTPEQEAYFDEHGFVHFRNFIDQEAVKTILTAIQQVEELWLAKGLKQVNGVPIKFGTDVDGRRFVQRFCFTSLYNPILHEFLKDPRFKALIPLLGQPGRIGENEKDGMVVNHYVNCKDSKYSRLGWHTDALRDLFYGKKIHPMLNVGVHLDDYPVSKGGLRLIPGTHKQKLWSMMFRKAYFVDNKPDAEEVGFDIRAGDLTVHDGRLWHRVERSALVGEASRRRVIYIPIICGKYQPKNASSRMPIYHRLNNLTR